MSSAWSATMRLSLPFSSFSRRSSLASSAFMPPYWLRQRPKVCSLMPSSLATSATFLPSLSSRSASRSLLTICSGVCFLPFFRVPSCPRGPWWNPHITWTSSRGSDHPKQRDAGLSLGLKPLQVARYVIIPQTIPFVVPPLLNSFVGLMKSATLASAVGAPEILYGGRNYMETTGHVAPAAVAIMGLYVIATVPLTRAVRSLEKRVQMRTRV